MSAISFDTRLAIPTLYNGVTFRSRLEARWAVFFDALGVPWLYEQEGMQLPSGRYLPDFLLPRADVWLELKPSDPSAQHVQRCRELCAATARRVILAYGDFGSWLPGRSLKWPMSALCLSPSLDPDGAVVCFGEDSDHEPCECPVCGEFGFEFEGRGARICKGKRNCCGASDRDHTSDSPRIVAAAEKADKWRFWK